MLSQFKISLGLWMLLLMMTLFVDAAGKIFEE
jgi:hypothetical protein